MARLLYFISFLLVTSVTSLPTFQLRGVITSCNEPGHNLVQFNSDLLIAPMPLADPDPQHRGYSSSVPPLCQLLVAELGDDLSIEPLGFKTVTLQNTDPPMALSDGTTGQLRLAVRNPGDTILQVEFSNCLFALRKFEFDDAMCQDSQRQSTLGGTFPDEDGLDWNVAPATGFQLFENPDAVA